MTSYLCHVAHMHASCSHIFITWWSECSGSGIDWIEMLDIIVVLDQANAIKSRSNRSVIRSCSNPNESMRFLITRNAILDDALIQTTLQERFW